MPGEMDHDRRFTGMDQPRRIDAARHRFAVRLARASAAGCFSHSTLSGTA